MSPPQSFDRYHRQMLLPQVQSQGQARLSRSRVLLVGCGALGTVIADQLVRAGVGYVRLVDRDIVETSNLQRQTLFDESDAREGAPKAIAASARLSAINSEVVIEPHIQDVNAGNIEQLVDGVDVILDGTDNVAIRYLINDVSVKRGVPWVYGAAVGVQGRMLAIEPGRTPCLRCLFPTPPKADELPTCDTAGVLGMAPAMVGALQATAAVKILLGKGGDAYGWFHSLDLWTNRLRVTDMRSGRRENCVCCVERRFEALDHPVGALTATLCGRHAVQVVGANPMEVDLAKLAERLGRVGTVRVTAHLVRCALAEGGVTLTVFRDGRAIVQNVSDPGRARSLYARYVGG